MLVSVLPAPVLRCLGCLGFFFLRGLFRISKREGDVPGTVLCPGGLCGQVSPLHDGLRVFGGPVLLFLPLHLVPPCSLSRCKGKFRTVFRSTEDNRSSTVKPIVFPIRLPFAPSANAYDSPSQNTVEVPPVKFIGNFAAFLESGSHNLPKY